MSTDGVEKPGLGEVNGKPTHQGRKERPQKRGGGRFEPYGNPSKRYRVFVSNIPFDVKWQALKDLMKEKVGEVTYVEHLTDAEGKSRGCAVVEFRTEELMKAAVEKVNKHNLNGRPLKVKEDPDGEFARRAAQRAQGGAGGGGPPGGMGMGMGPGPGAPPPPPMANVPPNLMDNPNIPSEIIHGLQAGKIGSTVFVANLDYKVGWKKLKEVFGMAGVVLRAELLEDKDGKSRGMATVTFDLPIEAVQAVSMFNGQLLFNRVMHVKLDEKSVPKEDFGPPEGPSSLPRGLSGIGLGLGPGGQPIDRLQINRGGSGAGGMGNMGPGGMDGMGFGGMGRMGGMDNYRGGMNNMDHFGPSGMGRMNDVDRGIGGAFDREFGRNDMGMQRRSFGDSSERGIGSSMGMDRMSSSMDGMGSGVGRMSGMDRMGMDRMDHLSDLDRLGPGGGFDRMGSGIDRLGPSVDRLGTSLDRMSSNVDRLGQAGFDRLGPSGLDRMSAGMDFMAPMGMDRMSSGLDRMGSNFNRAGSAGIDRFPTTGLDRMGSTMDRMGGPSMDRMGGPSMDRMGGPSMDRMGGPSMDRMGGPSMDRMGGPSMDRMGPARVGGQFDRPAEMERGGFGSPFGGAGAGGPGAGANPRKGCQIFVRNLPFDFTWQMLKDTFNSCGIVQYADVKTENGKSKGCGVVRFENPETAERACRTMNGYRLNGREIDVRIDRNA